MSLPDSFDSERLPEVGRVEHAVLYHWPTQDEFFVERREVLARFEKREDAMAFITEANAESREQKP